MLKIVFLILMAGGIPVAMAMAGASLIYIMVSGNLPPFVVIHRMIGGIDSFPLLAVPFFILAGNLMNNAGHHQPHLQLCARAGRLAAGRPRPRQRGRLGDLRRHERHCDRRRRRAWARSRSRRCRTTATETEFAVGVTAASATLGPIIPPSLPFVIYAMMANVSVGALFLAGILPGAADGAADDADGRLLRRTRTAGAATSVHRHALRQGGRRDAGGRRWPMAMYYLVAVRCPAAGHGDRGPDRAVRGRPLFPLRGGAADHDAGAADRRHVHRHLHAHRGRDRSLRVGDGAGPRVVSHAELEALRQGLPRHRGDHCHRDVHRRRGIDLRLDAHRHRRHRGDRAMGAGVHPEAVAVSCCWPTC